jgi:tetratricopeptide (TPR) repeat protein
MRTRDAALAALRDSLARVAATQDLSTVLSDETQREAEELAALADPVRDLAAANALGTFHWFRYVALPDGDGEVDLSAAARFLAPVFIADPQAVPEPLRWLYQQSSGSAAASHAIDLFTTYQRTGELLLLTEAVALLRAAVAATLYGNPNRLRYLTYLSNALRVLSGRTGDTAVLAEWVQTCRDVVADSPDDDPSRRTGGLCTLGNALLELFRHTGDPAALTEAVQISRDVLAAPPSENLSRAARLSNLSNTLLELSRQTGDLAALTEGVQIARDAAAATPDDHPDRAGRLCNLGGALLELSQRTGDPAVLTEAVHTCRDAVAASPQGHPDRATCLADLIGALLELYDHTEDTAVLAEAVQVGRDAVAASPQGHPRRAICLNNLGVALRQLSERTEDTTALAEAAEAGADAVAATQQGHPDHARHLSNFRTTLRLLIERTEGHIVDHPDHARHLSGLGAALVEMFERTGDTTVLGQAVQMSRDAVAATPDGHPDRADTLRNLASALRAVYTLTGDTAMLAEAAQFARDAVGAAPDGHPDRADCLNILGITLRLLFQRTADTARLIEAVQMCRAAVAATPDGNPNRAIFLSNLGNGLLDLFERTGDTTVLAEAVQVCRDSAAATPDDHPDRAGRLNNLGTALAESSRRTGDPAALAEAVQVRRDVVAATPDGDPSRAGRLNNLGTALAELSRRTGNAAVAKEAVHTCRAAVAATPDGHLDQAMCLTNLINALMALFERTGDITVLAEAVRVGRRAVAATPDGHVNRVMCLTNLGNALGALSDATGDTFALFEAGRCFKQAAGNASAAVVHRIGAYRRLARIPDLAGGSPLEALAAVEAAVELLPQLAPRALGRADREYNLGALRSLAEEAAVLAVTAGRPGRAVELLEQTRGVLVADTLDARSSDLTRLRGHQSDLADEFYELRARIDALDRPGLLIPQSADAAGGEPDIGQARRDAHAAWDDLVARIRGIDGFANFLQPPGIRQLATHAFAGPIVFVYTNRSRCDALILTDDHATPVRLVPLNDLAEVDAYQQTRRLLIALRVSADNDVDPAMRIAAQTDILDTLAWMWDAIAEPILAALGHTTGPAADQQWSRVWWCPVGILAYLPLHAAGHHNDLTVGQPNPRTVLDRVVSSYTTTVRGLAYARTQNPDPDAITTLIIAVPDPPDAPPLDGAAAEADLLASLIPEARSLPYPTRDSVLSELPACPVVHFACHGYADWDKPAASQLTLYDHQIAPLTVADIGALHLTGGLAYLSACDTTVTNLALTNEAVHITGAFHLAGYQHVIGTLWRVSDTAARDLASDIYTHLTHHGSTPPDINRAALALHHAARRLRGKYPASPTIWAAHTHTGT